MDIRRPSFEQARALTRPTSPPPAPAPSGTIDAGTTPTVAKSEATRATGATRPATTADGLSPSRQAEARVVGAVGGVAAKPTSGIDAAVGLHLKRALGGASLQSGAANAKHVTKMEQSAKVIAVVERLPGRLGSITSFSPKDAFRLYEHCFPNPDEREPIADIKARLKTYDRGATPDGAAFHAHAFADDQGRVVGYAQGSTVPTPSGEGLFYYWQYGCVADRAYMQDNYGVDTNPREHGVLNTMHGIAAATLVAGAAKADKAPLAIVWESEPRGLGDDRDSIRFTDTRLGIHNRAGGRVMMGVDDEGRLVNLHLQPRLTADSEPIALHMMVRPLAYEEGEEKARGELPVKDAEQLMLGFINNFRLEGFPEKDVREAEDEIKKRFQSCQKVVLLPPGEVPDVVTLAAHDPILARQVLDMYGVKSLDEARATYDAAMG